MKIDSWRKSERSMNNGNCVEVGSAQLIIAIRDTADPDGALLAFPVSSWREFVVSLK